MWIRAGIGNAAFASMLGLGVALPGVAAAPSSVDQAVLVRVGGLFAQWKAERVAERPELAAYRPGMSDQILIRKWEPYVLVCSQVLGHIYLFGEDERSDLRLLALRQLKLGSGRGGPAELVARCSEAVPEPSGVSAAALTPEGREQQARFEQALGAPELGQLPALPSGERYVPKFQKYEQVLQYVWRGGARAAKRPAK